LGAETKTPSHTVTTTPAGQEAQQSTPGTEIAVATQPVAPIVMAPPVRVVSPAQIMRAGGIKGAILQPRLQELGKIKIGRKGPERKSSNGRTFRVPEKLDHFVVTTNERDNDGDLIEDTNLALILAKNPRELDIALLSNDPNVNMPTYLGYYISRQCFCFGDGVTGWRAPTKEDERGKRVIVEGDRLPCTCPCPYFDETEGARCKANGILSVQLVKARVLGGVYRFRTTSVNSISNILSSMELIKLYTGGILAGLPLSMTLSPMTKDIPIRGVMQSTTFWVVSIVYKGDAEALQLAATQAAERRLHFTKSVKELEQKAQMLLQSAPVSETDADVADEFYPELESGNVKESET
jgi:Recombination directionality factor-like